MKKIDVLEHLEKMNDIRYKDIGSNKSLKDFMIEYTIDYLNDFVDPYLNKDDNSILIDELYDDLIILSSQEFSNKYHLREDAYRIQFELNNYRKEYIGKQLAKYINGL